MIAPTNFHYRRLPSADFDPTAGAQGDVSQSITQLFTIRTAGVIRHPQSGRLIREWLFDDQFGNVYLAYRAVCVDGDEYDINDRLKPSIIAAHGGISGDLLDKYRQKAFWSFENTDRTIRITRAVASDVSKKIIDGEKLLIPGTDLAKP